MATGAMGVMSEKFGSASAAYSYLIFVLLYIPCISVMGAIARVQPRLDGVLHPVGLKHRLLAGDALTRPLTSASIRATARPASRAVVLFNVLVLGLLRRARSRVDINLLANRKTATCCNSPAGDCH